MALNGRQYVAVFGVDGLRSVVTLPTFAIVLDVPRDTYAAAAEVLP
jgi:hypothetical protein